jgi:hypothetical protein
VERPGFCIREDVPVGCSPDGFLGDDMGLEIKCPLAHTHVGYLIDGRIPAMYVPQVQGSMWVTGRPRWTFFSYHPDLDPLIVVVQRDEEFHAALEKYLTKFLSDLATDKEALIARGCKPWTDAS